MKRVQFTRNTLIIYVIMLLALSLYTAYQTYQHKIVFGGIMGIAMIYLLFFYISHSKIDMSLETILSDPKKINISFTFSLDLLLPIGLQAKCSI